MGTIYLELEYICPQNGSAVLKGIQFRVTPLFTNAFSKRTPVMGTNDLELEYICPQNGSAVLKGIPIRITPLFTKTF